MDSQAQHIVIRTCDRPAYLRRLLLSVSRRSSPEPVNVLVFDDSRDVTTANANQQVVDSARRRFGLEVRYLGRGWQQAFCAELTRCSPGDAAAIEWLLAERPKGVFTGGRMLNLIMLALAGQRFTLFDDDYLLDRARHLGQGLSRQLDWSRDPPRQILGHLSVRESRAAGQEMSIDPVTEHLKYLGRRVRDCITPGKNGAAPLLDATHAGTPADLLKLDRDSLILSTVNGQYGVPISPNAFYLFYQSHSDTGPVWADAEHYRVLRQGKAIWNVTYGPVIADKTGSTPSALDNRHMMPPTLPHCRGEDTLFCTLLKYLHPNAAHLYLPWALEHSRRPSSWIHATFEQSQKIMLAKMVWKKVEHMAEAAPPGLSPEQRLQLLSERWLQWSELPRDQLRDEIINAFQRGLRWRMKIMSNCLQQVEDKSGLLHGDLSRATRQFEADLQMTDGFPGLEDAPGISGTANRIDWLAGVGREFGLALGAWPRLWHAARDLQRLD